MNVAGALDFAFCRCPTPSQLAGHLPGYKPPIPGIIYDCTEMSTLLFMVLQEVNVPDEPFEARLVCVTSDLCLSGDGHVSKF